MGRIGGMAETSNDQRRRDLLRCKEGKDINEGNLQGHLKQEGGRGGEAESGPVVALNETTLAFE